MQNKETKQKEKKNKQKHIKQEIQIKGKIKDNLVEFSVDFLEAKLFKKVPER